MSKLGYLALPAAIVLAAPATAQQPEAQAVQQALAESVAGWNAGDVARFMAVYSDDPQTSLVTSQGLTRGKAAMTARFNAQYDFNDSAKRGVLSIKMLDFRLLDPTHALYIGQYLLTYGAGKTETGPTTLIFAKEATGWKIIADHSS